MKYFITACAAAALMLGACDSSKPDIANPELLKGKAFYVSENGTHIILDFDETELMVSGEVVNHYSGPYVASGNKITFQPFVSTMKMGEPEAMKVEQEYFNFMSNAETYSIDDYKLTITDKDGNTMTFEVIAK